MKSLMNLYNTNTLFHSFVLGLEMALVSFITSYNGGLPTTKAAWVSLALGVGGAVWGAIKRWLANNVATQPVAAKAV
jgi:hypothetical protein